MLRAAVWTLRQRRYRALAVAMLFVAFVCLGLGSFEVHRYQEKRHGNDTLIGNAHAAPVPLTPALVPLTGAGRAPGAMAIRYRTVTAVGQYLVQHQEYVANQSQGGLQGFSVLTPLRTATGTVLVVRGFVAATSELTRPASIAAPPSGVVAVSGRLDTAQSSRDQLGRLGHGEINSIDPAEQAGRIGAPTYQAYVTLDAGQPGTAGLQVVPPPSLDNPTGGAGELQLLSYVIQWYAFAVLAILAPFLFSRSEAREARKQFLGLDAESAQFDALPAAPGSGLARLDPSGVSLARRGSLATRPAGELVERSGVPVEQWRRAARLADRYGRSLGVDTPDGGTAPLGRRARRGIPELPAEPVARNSAEAPHRSGDEFHGGYNDLLWRLALADGEVPDVGPQLGPARPTEEPSSDGERPVP